MKKRSIHATVSAMALTGILSCPLVYAQDQPQPHTYLQTVLNEAAQLGLLDELEKQPGLLDSIASGAQNITFGLVGSSNSLDAGSVGSYLNIGINWYSYDSYAGAGILHYVNRFDFSPYMWPNGPDLKIYDATGEFVPSTVGMGLLYYFWLTPTEQVPFFFVAAKPNVEVSPKTTASLSGNQGNNGWYVSPVQLSFSAQNGELGTYYVQGDMSPSFWWSGEPNDYTSPLSFSTDGKYSIWYWSKNAAGVREIPQTVSFNIDQTAPTINVTNPTNGSYLDDASPTVTYSVNDTMSGVNTSSITSTFDGQPITNGTTIPLYTLSLGVHTLTVSAADNAGNTATQTVTFKVGTSVDSLKNLVSHFTNNGSIDDAGVSNALTAKLDSGSLQAFVNQVEAQSGKHISPSAAQVLLRDAKFLREQ